MFNIEGLPHKESTAENFIFSTIEKERGEIERVAEKFEPQDLEAFVASFYEAAQKASLVDLTEQIWSTLENTDSFDISNQGWEQVTEHVTHVNEVTGSARDWEGLRQKNGTRNKT